MSLSLGDQGVLVNYIQDLIRSTDFFYQKTRMVDFNMIKNLATYLYNLTYVADPLDVIEQVKDILNEYNPHWEDQFVFRVNKEMTEIRLTSPDKKTKIDPGLASDIDIYVKAMGYKVNYELSRSYQTVIDRKYEQIYPKGTSFYFNRYGSSAIEDYYFKGIILDKNTYSVSRERPDSGCYTARMPLERRVHTFLVIGDRYTWDLENPSPDDPIMDDPNPDQVVRLGSLLDETKTSSNVIIQNLSPSFSLKTGCFYRTYDWGFNPNPLTDIAAELAIQLPLYNLTFQQLKDSNIAVHDVTDYVQLRDDIFFVKLDDPDLQSKLAKNEINDFNQIYKLRDTSKQYEISDELIEILLRSTIDQCSPQLNIEYLQNLLRVLYNNPDFLNGIWTDVDSMTVKKFKRDHTSELFYDDIVFKKTELNMLKAATSEKTHGQYFGNW